MRCQWGKCIPKIYNSVEIKMATVVFLVVL